MTIKFTQVEWDKLRKSYPPGASVSGVVESQQPYGVWVKLDELPEVPALLEVIHFEIIESAPNNRIEFPCDYPNVGKKIDARILGWCEFPKDVRLTQLRHLDWNNRDVSGRRTKEASDR